MKVFFLVVGELDKHLGRANHLIEGFWRKGIEIVGVHHVGAAPKILTNHRPLTPSDFPITCGPNPSSDVPTDCLIFYSTPSFGLFLDFVAIKRRKQPLVVDLRDVSENLTNKKELVNIVKGAELVVTTSPAAQSIVSNVSGRSDVHFIPNATTLSHLPFYDLPPLKDNPYIVSFGYGKTREVTKVFLSLSNYLPHVRFYLFSTTPQFLFQTGDVYRLGVRNNIFVCESVHPYLLASFCARASAALHPYRFEQERQVADSLSAYDSLAMNIPTVLINSQCVGGAHLVKSFVSDYNEKDIEKIAETLKEIIEKGSRVFSSEDEWRSWLSENCWERRVEKWLELLKPLSPS